MVRSALAPSRTMGEEIPSSETRRRHRCSGWASVAQFKTATFRQVFRMSKAPPAPPSLQELRKEIDAIDEQVHTLLLQRGDIIDRLIAAKQTQEVGSAFRPARES